MVNSMKSVLVIKNFRTLKLRADTSEAKTLALPGSAFIVGLFGR